MVPLCSHFIITVKPDQLISSITSDLYNMGCSIIKHYMRSLCKFSHIWSSARVKPILHYALGLRFGKVCEQKREQKREKNATGLIFTPMHSVMSNNFLAFFSRWVIFLAFSVAFLILTYQKRE